MLNDSELAGLCRDAGFGRPDLHTVIACALAASAGMPEYASVAYPGPAARYVGLWGIDTTEWPDYAKADLNNPYVAVEAARRLTVACDGFHWCPAFRSGQYWAYLPRAAAAATMVVRPTEQQSPVHAQAAARGLDALRRRLAGTLPSHPLRIVRGH